MAGKRVFIGWTGESRYIADKIGLQLNQRGFETIVGGEDKDSSMFVGTTVIDQMNRAEMAILLFEQRSPEKGGGVSANVMFEWGYLLHKLSKSNNIRIFLLDMDDKLLPTDVRGCWFCPIKKPAAGTPEEKEQMYGTVAEEIVQKFLERNAADGFIGDKLDCFDRWEETKQLILNYNGNERISYRLIYGLQMCIYTGKSKIIYDKLQEIRSQSGIHPELKQVINCAMACLNVFITTHNLTTNLSENQFLMLMEDLQVLRLDQVKDPDLAAWCNIFRQDKMELCYEFYANSLSGEEKHSALHNAVQKCHRILRMLDKQIAANSADKYFAMLYQGFTHRNLYLLYKALEKLNDPDIKPEDIAFQCAESLKYREALYFYYKDSHSPRAIAMDYITQEYLLGLVEQYQFELDPDLKEDMSIMIQGILLRVRENYDIRNMIYTRIMEAVSGIPEIK